MNGQVDHGSLEKQIDDLARDRRGPGLNSAIVCDRLARAYVPGAEPRFRITSLDSDDPRRVVADRYWHLRLQDDPRILTAALCGGWIREQVDAEVQRDVIESWSLGFGFVLRDRVETYSEILAASDDVAAADNGSEVSIATACLVHAGKLRAGFAFRELNRFLDSPLVAKTGSWQQSAVVAGLRAFAVLGSSTFTRAYAVEEFIRCWQAPDRSRTAVDLALNGMAIAAPFPEQGKLLVTHATEAVDRYPGDHAMLHWLARGQALAGDHTTALTTVEHALDALPAAGWRSSYAVMSEQYIRFRSDIAARLTTGP